MSTNVKVRERVPTGRRGRPSKSMIAAAMERPFCAYLHKICLNNRLEGHKYCIDHIMNDKTAPYRQCTYVHTVTGRRCTRAAHKVDRRASPLCQYHRASRLTHQTQVQAAEVVKDFHTSLIEDLGHHKPGSINEVRPQSTFWHQLDNGAAVPSPKLTRTLANYNLKRLTEDLEPMEMPTAEDIATRHNNADSDTESVDNSYDLFKNASVYTEEEVLRTLRDKMIRLRRLYIEQYSHIQYLLKEKRLKYIQAQRLEDETYGEIFSFRNYPDSPDYKRLRAMLKYHKSFGPDYLLQQQAKSLKSKKGTKSEDNALNTTQDMEPPSRHICIFSKTPQNCDKPSLPLSPYCSTHILYDNKQVLFRPCAGGMPPCLNPVVSFTRKNKCQLHTDIN